MRYPYGETVGLIPVTYTRDALGNDVPTEGATVNVLGCPVWPDTTTELVQGQDQVIDVLSVLLPPGTTVTALYRLMIRGVKHEISGKPFDYTSPFTGTRTGVLVHAKVVTG